MQSTSRQAPLCGIQNIKQPLTLKCSSLFYVDIENKLLFYPNLEKQLLVLRPHRKTRKAG